LPEEATNKAISSGRCARRTHNLVETTDLELRHIPDFYKTNIHIMSKVKIFAIGVFSSVLGIASMASAQAYSVASSTAQLADTLADIGLILAAVIGVALASWVGLAGLKYGIRKFGKYIGFGGKF